MATKFVFGVSTYLISLRYRKIIPYIILYNGQLNTDK